MRFSAMGDVALLTPAIVAIAAEYPSVKITLVTRGNYAPFFYNIPNVDVVGFNIRRFKGLRGIWNFYKEISLLGPFYKVIDLHSSLRSRLLSFLFRLKGVPTFRIIKGRKEKQAQIRRKNKILTHLPHTVDRYMNVFSRAGFEAKIRQGPWINVDPDSKFFALDYPRTLNVSRTPNKLWIGFAPFAGHALKIWPFHKSIALIKLIQREFNATIFLFGSNSEMTKLKILKEGIEDCHIVNAGQMGIKGELGMMEKLHVLIGMDSSNVHIAALLKVPVVGIYGTTHPYSGFGPYGQDELGVLQVETLSCRPCSIYGNTACYRKDFACMELIDPMDVINRVKLVLKDKLRPNHLKGKEEV